MKSCRIAVLQYSASNNLESNLKHIDEALEACNADMAVLPENALMMGGNAQEKNKLAQNIKAKQQLASLARKHKIWLVAGTLPVLREKHKPPVSRCYIFDNTGEEQYFYDKVHLFDVTLPDGEQYHESNDYSPGSQVGLFDSPWGKIGIAVCYDIRFPEYMRLLSELGMEVLIVPAAFTYTTGEKHWEVLLRARAIENQCYVVAAGQCGEHADKRKTWGHSMIVDPNGEILSSAKHQAAIIDAELAAQPLQQLRQTMPVLKHRRF